MLDGVGERLDGARDRWLGLLRRLRRLERRELREFAAWLEDTENLLHLSVLLFVPLLVGAVTAISNAVSALPFLLFPPLASGGYALFSNPESRYASPVRFVAGLTAGALCGFVALEATARLWYQVDPASLEVNAGAAAFGVLLTGLVIWLLDVEEAQAYSTSLLVLVTDLTPDTGPALYVVSVLVSTSFVATVFVLWRRHFYEHRARYLYRSTKGDDHVLVPMAAEGSTTDDGGSSTADDTASTDDGATSTAGGDAGATAMLGARLAAAHDAGKVVLLDVVSDAEVSATRTALREGESPAAAEAPADAAGDLGRSDAAEGDLTSAEGDPASADEGELTDLAERQLADERAEALERRARRIETRVGVPCQVVVAADGEDRAATVLRTARETNCNLIVAPYEERNGRLAPFVRSLFGGDVDVLVHRSADGREDWSDVLVPVRRAGDVAHAMLEFASRLVGSRGSIAACHCLGRGGDRRRAEEMLAALVETVPGDVETRVSGASIETFLARTASHYDLVILGASTDRTTASRFVSPPTFERLRDVDADVAILDRNFG